MNDASIAYPWGRGRRPGRTPAAGGFTLVELLVVIAIIGVLIGMTIPAIQGLREMSRRAACSQHLTKLSLALSAYHSQYGHYPAGTIAAAGPVRSEPIGFHHNWISGLMPMVDAPNVAAAIDRSAGVYDPANQAVRELEIPFLQCPSAVLALPYQATYAGNQHPDEAPIDEGNQGVFFLNETISNDDIRDGLAYTLFVSEQVQSFGKPLSWMSGTRATLRNTGHAINAHRQTPVNGWGPAFQDPLFVGGFSSQHPQGAQALDGARNPPGPRPSLHKPRSARPDLVSSLSAFVHGKTGSVSAIERTSPTDPQARACAHRHAQDPPESGRHCHRSRTA